METKIIAYVLVGLVLLFGIYLIIGSLKTRRLVQLMRFCQQDGNPECGELINKVDLKRLEVQRFTLCMYFYKFIEAGDLEKLNKLYLNLQTVKDPKKKELCDSTFAQAVSSTKARQLTLVTANALIKEADGPKLEVTEAIIAIIANMTPNSRNPLYLGICDRLHDFRQDRPDCDGFVFVTLLKLKKALNV